MTVSDIMEVAGIWAGGDDWLISEAAPLANELVGVFGFDFVLKNSRACEPEHPLKACGGNRACAANQGKFSLALYGAQPVQQRSQAPVVVKWVFRLCFRDEACIAALHFHHGAFVLVGIQKDVVAFAH